MSKALVIAEKPSVARDIASALGGFTSKGKYFERGDMVVASARGHLARLIVNQEDDPGWVLDRLPVIPEQFVAAPIPSTKGNDTEGLLSELKALIRRSDISLLINACDAGREGELIFRLIVQCANNSKPIERMWLQSMTPAGIKEAYKNRRSDSEVAGLESAARSRAEADFLVGVNATRALTKSNIVVPGEKITAGRVQTPVLAMVVDLELRRRSFVPTPFWEVLASFKADAGGWIGKWIDPTPAAAEAGQQPNEQTRRTDRTFERATAQAVVDACKGQNPSSVTDTSKPVLAKPPSLFDLTLLQREANKLFGFSASDTLKIAQSLYERAKMLTYSRTSSQHLPEDYVDTVVSTLGQLPAAHQAHAQRLLEDGLVSQKHPNFNNAKITDHFAIIPTGTVVEGLNEGEQMIYDLVARRFIASFMPAAEYLETIRVAVIAEHQFKATGKVQKKASWEAVYPGLKAKAQSSPGDGRPGLPLLSADEKVVTEEVKTHQGETSPPPRFTEATLLAAMESAGKQVEDEEMASAMAGSGLGTPATRAKTIEDMLSPTKGYCERKGKELVPLDTGIRLITALRDAGVAMLTQPALTGAWELRLAKMERGEEARAAFMNDIESTTRDLVDQIRNRAIPDDPSRRESRAGQGGSRFQDKDTGVACHCKKGTITESPKLWSCTACELKIWRTVAEKVLGKSELRALMKEGITPLVTGLKARSGNNFSAQLELGPQGKLNFVYPEKAERAGNS